MTRELNKEVAETLVSFSDSDRERLSKIWERATRNMAIIEAFFDELKKDINQSELLEFESVVADVAEEYYLYDDIFNLPERGVEYITQKDKKSLEKVSYIEERVSLALDLMKTKMEKFGYDFSVIDDNEQVRDFDDKQVALDVGVDYGKDSSVAKQPNPTDANYDQHVKDRLVSQLFDEKVDPYGFLLNDAPLGLERERSKKKLNDLRLDIDLVFDRERVRRVDRQHYYDVEFAAQYEEIKSAFNVLNNHPSEQEYEAAVLQIEEAYKVIRHEALSLVMATRADREAKRVDGDTLALRGVEAVREDIGTARDVFSNFAKNFEGNEEFKKSVEYQKVLEIIGLIDRCDENDSNTQELKLEKYLNGLWRTYDDLYKKFGTKLPTTASEESVDLSEDKIMAAGNEYKAFYEQLPEDFKVNTQILGKLDEAIDKLLRARDTKNEVAIAANLFVFNSALEDAKLEFEEWKNNKSTPVEVVTKNGGDTETAQKTNEINGVIEFEKRRLPEEVSPVLSHRYIEQVKRYLENEVDINNHDIFKTLHEIFRYMDDMRQRGNTASEIKARCENDVSNFVSALERLPAEQSSILDLESRTSTPVRAKAASDFKINYPEAKPVSSDRWLDSENKSGRTVAKLAYREKEKEYNEALAAYFARPGLLGKIVGTRKILGINVDLPPELKSLQDEYRASKARYAELLNWDIEKRSQKTQSILDETSGRLVVKNNYEYNSEDVRTKAAFARRFILKPQADLLSLQERHVLPARAREVLSRTMATLAKHKNLTRIGMALGVGLMAGASGGVGAFAAAGSWQLMKAVTASAAGSSAAGLTYKLYGRSVASAENVLKTNEDRAIQKFSLNNLIVAGDGNEKAAQEIEKLAKRYAEALAADRSIKSSRKLAAVTAAVVAGGATGFASAGNLLESANMVDVPDGNNSPTPAGVGESSEVLGQEGQTGSNSLINENLINTHPSLDSYQVKPGDTLGEIIESEFSEKLKALPVKERGAVLDVLYEKLNAKPEVLAEMGMRSNDVDLIYVGEELDLNVLGRELDNVLERQQIIEGFKNGPLTIEADTEIKDVPIRIVEKPIPGGVEINVDEHTYTEATADTVPNHKPIYAPKITPLNGVYTDHPQYKSFIETLFGNGEKLDEDVMQYVKNFDSSRYDPLDKFLGSTYESPYTQLSSMNVNQYLEFKNSPSSVLREYFSRPEINIKYDVYLAWKDRIDELIKTMPNKPTTTIEDLVKRSIIDNKIALHNKGI